MFLFSYKDRIFQSKASYLFKMLFFEKCVRFCTFASLALSCIPKPFMLWTKVLVTQNNIKEKSFSKCLDGIKTSADEYWSAPYIAALPPPAYLPGRLPEALLLSNEISYLKGGFVLRCLQHLSLPNLATQRCSWRNNWCTSGLSIPVLSY